MTGSPTVVLDIGASKVACMVGEIQEGHQLKILGAGTSPCRGIRRSAVIDMPRVVEAIYTAVSEAERAAGLKITGAYVGIAGEDISVQTNHSAIAISGTSTPIGEGDVKRALEAAEQATREQDTTVLHRFVQNHMVDGEWVQNPLWLYGNKLEVETLSITASGSVCTTLRRAAEQAGIEIVDFILETVGAASTLISPDEREMGIGLLDLGAGTSNLALFQGPLRHVAEIPFGGDDITKDLSVVLNMSPRDAEKIKQDYGCVRPSATAAEQNIEFRTTAGRPHQINCHHLSDIIEARQQEILEFVAQELERNPWGRKLSAGLIFTGGGALLGNLAQLGEEILGVPVRLGTPQSIIAPESVLDPRFATAVGLLHFAIYESAKEDHAFNPIQPNKGLFDRITKIFSFLM